MSEKKIFISINGHVIHGKNGKPVAVRVVPSASSTIANIKATIAEVTGKTPETVGFVTAISYEHQGMRVTIKTPNADSNPSITTDEIHGKTVSVYFRKNNFDSENFKSSSMLQQQQPQQQQRQRQQQQQQPQQQQRQRQQQQQQQWQQPQQPRDLPRTWAGIAAIKQAAQIAANQAVKNLQAKTARIDIDGIPVDASLYVDEDHDAAAVDGDTGRGNLPKRTVGRDGLTNAGKSIFDELASSMPQDGLGTLTSEQVLAALIARHNRDKKSIQADIKLWFDGKLDLSLPPWQLQQQQKQQQRRPPPASGKAAAALPGGSKSSPPRSLPFDGEALCSS